LIEQAQKLEPFLVSMPFLTKAVDLAVGRIQGGEQSRGAIAFVVVGHRLAAAALQRQARLGTIQGLDLAFLVHAQHQSMLRWVQVQAHDVFQFFCELGIVADLESLDPMRIALQSRHAQGQEPPPPRGTFLGVIFIVVAISLSCRPSAANSTMRARSTARAGSDRLRVRCSKAARWSGLKVIDKVQWFLTGRSPRQTPVRYFSSFLPVPLFLSNCSE
jgi:hypothetical protein